MTLTEYSPFSKSTPSTSTKSPVQAEIQHCYGEDTDKKPLRMHQITPFQVKIHFWGVHDQTLPLVGRGTPTQHPVPRPQGLMFVIQPVKYRFSYQ